MFIKCPDVPFLGFLFERTFKISRIVRRRFNGDAGDHQFVIILSHYAFLLLLERESIV